MIKKIKSDGGVSMRVAIALFVSVIFISGAAFATTNYINAIGQNISIGNSNEIFIDNTNGFVGIGTTGPAKAFHVNGTSAAEQVRIEGSASFGTMLELFETSRRGWLGIDPSGDALIAGATSQATILNSVADLFLISGDANTRGIVVKATTGFVGIGTTTPQQRLDVNGSINVTNIFVNGGIILNGSNPFTNVSVNYGYNGSAFVPLITDSNGALMLVVNQSGTANGLNPNAAGSDLSLSGNLAVTRNLTVGSTTLFVNQLTGNVGIGTTGPAGVLHITTPSGTAPLLTIRGNSAGNDEVVIQTVSYGTGDSLLQFNANAGVSSWSAGIDISDSGKFKIGEAFDTAELTITTGGNVGIGTTSPFYSLDIASINALRLQTDGALINASGGALGIYAEDQIVFRADSNGDTVATDGFYFRDGNTDRMFIREDGNVGIGTTTPLAKLDVNGTVRLNGPTSDTASTFASWSDITSKSLLAGGTAYWAIREGTTAVGSINVDVYNSGSPTTALTILNNGSVGIGTTGPAYKLTVGQNTAGDNTDYNVAILRHGTTASPGTYTAGISALAISDVSGDGPTTLDTQGLLQVGAGRIADSDTYAANAILFGVSNDDGSAFVVKGNRNVGIRTTTPSEVLSVAGNVSITGTTCRDSGGSATCDNFVDFAELFSASESVESGDIVAAAGNSTVRKSKGGDAAVGIVSTQPAIVIEGNKIVAMGGSTYQNNTMKPAVALAGRVPVKVSTENGPIRIGDYITSSSLAGVGMRADSGRTVGIALENFDGGSKCGAYRCGKVVVLVNVGENVGKIVMDQQKQIDSLQKENVAIKREFETRLAALEAKIK